MLSRGISKAYGSFWNIYPLQVYSNNEIISGAVNIYPRKLEKWYWLVDNSAFERVEGKSCVILSEEENEEGSSSAYVQCGVPVDIFTIKDVYLWRNYTHEYYKTDLIVYMYDEDVADTLTDGLKDGILTVSDMDFNWIGRLNSDSIVLGNGGIIHGPYSEIAKGNYRVTIEGDSLTNCQTWIISESNPENISFSVDSLTDNVIEIELSVINYVNDLQVVLYNDTDEEAKFYQIRVESR